MRRPLILTVVALALASASPAAAACSIGSILQLPVTMSGSKPIITARLNGHDAPFIVDSGAFSSLISATAAGRLGLTLQPAPARLRLQGIGGESAASIATVHDFALGSFALHDVHFIVSGPTLAAAGLLGQNVLGAADVEYDLGNGTIRLLKPQDCPKQPLAYWAAGKSMSELPIFPPGLVGRHTVATVFLNGKKMRAVFDTGASTSLVTRQAAARAGVTPDSPGVVQAGYARGLGKGVDQAWIGPFKSVKIGNEQIKDVRLRFGDLGGEPFDMLIGVDFFLSHRIYVANSQDKLYFTYNGGPVFNTGVVRGAAATTADTDLPAIEPKTADDYVRRASLEAARSQVDAALADLDQAVRLAPAEPRYLVERAQLHLLAHQPEVARADLDAALKLNPTLAVALVARAGLEAASNKTAAIADIDAAERVLPKDAEARLPLGRLLARLDMLDRAIEEDNLWIASHPDDSRRAEALNDRCWARGLAGRDLAAALDDCNGAVAALPNSAATLDSRGLVRLRLGDYAGAIKDYDAALAIAPQLAWPMYGRGLAHAKLGQQDEAKADLAAATALQPKLPEVASAHGLRP